MNARKTAYDVLADVLDNGAYMHLSMKQHINAGFSPADKKFIAALVNAALENIFQIDYALGTLTHQKKIKKSAINVLRLGAAQIMHMYVPDAAAVDESVKLIKSIGKEPLSGFVNAVLRSLIRQKDGIVYPDERKTPAAYLSVACGYPEWLCEEYIAQYGYQFTKNMLTYRKPDNLTSVRANQLRTTVKKVRQHVGEEGFETLDSPFFNALFYIKGLTDPENMNAFKNGELAVQGVSSYMAVHAMKLNGAKVILDACAAPGGKTALMAEMLNNKGSIIAGDIHPHRLKLTDKNLLRLNVKNTALIQRDAARYHPDFKSRFDVVLVDAPCSALGLSYRRPDIKIRLTSDKVKSLQALQRRILLNCAQYVKKTGFLYYMTCTLSRRENEDNIAWFTKQNAQFKAGDLKRLYAGIRPRVQNGMIQLYPHIDGMDGFFIAEMERV